MKNFYLFAGMVVLTVLPGCISTGVNYRPLAGYEAGHKHWCAVEKKLFMPDENSSAVDYGVKTSFLCCAKCVTAFKENKDLYAEPEAVEYDTGRNAGGGTGGGFGGGGGGHGGHSGH